jgi:hypothetical protein
MKSKSYVSMTSADALRRDMERVLDFKRKLVCDAVQDRDVMEDMDFSSANADDFAWVWESESA